MKFSPKGEIQQDFPRLTAGQIRFLCVRMCAVNSQRARHMGTNIRLPEGMKEDFDLGCARLTAWASTRAGLTGGRVYKGEIAASAVTMLGVMSLARPSMLDNLEKAYQKIEAECASVGGTLRCGSVPVELLLAYRALLEVAEDQDMEGLKIAWERIDGAVRLLPDDVDIESVMRRMEQEVAAMLEVRQG